MKRMTKIIDMPRMWTVTVKETRTRRYYVRADNEIQAQELYLLEGLTSSVYDTDFDRVILTAEPTKKMEDE
jgi:hypothetical protein|tara:strand:- start:1181 stop:1393 length:213 start_codon:yes stop_codon:yes gene_type:complete